jgi:hypothetical protein
VPARFGLLRALGAVVDYVIGDPLHFAMERKMMLGLKQRAEQPPAISDSPHHVRRRAKERGGRDLRL